VCCFCYSFLGCLPGAEGGGVGWRPGFSLDPGAGPGLMVGHPCDPHTLGGWLATRDDGRTPPAPGRREPGDDHPEKLDALDAQLQALKDEQHAREAAPPANP